MFNPERDTTVALWRRILPFVEKRWVILSILILLLVTIYVSYDGLHAYLAPPDDFHHVHTWKFGQRSLVWLLLSNTYGEMHAGGHYRPFEVLSFMIDTFIWGEYTAGRHVTNLVFHFVNTILVLAIAYFITQNKAASFIAGLLFAVHPAHLSAVAWISGRTDVIATTFCLISFVLFALFIKRRSPFTYVLALVAFLFGLLSKEIALVMPLLVLSFELFFSRQYDHAEIDDRAKKTHFDGIVDKKAKFWSIMLLSFGFLSLGTGVLSNPGFIAKYLARDGTFSGYTTSWLELVRWYATILGCCSIICGIFFRKALALFAKLPGRLSLGFFILLALYLPFRMQVLGSIGGYNDELSNNVNTHMQMSLISFVRDFYGLIGLLWPLDYDYNMKILLFQKTHEILFWGVFAGAILLLIASVVKGGWKHKPTLFSLLMIPILGMPVHNFLIRNTFYDSRYLYSLTVAVCLFAGVQIWRAISYPRFRNTLARASVSILLLMVVLAAGSRLREFNKRYAETGQIMQKFVTAIERYRDRIHKNTDFCLLTFPFLPIDIDRHIWVTAYLQDPVEFVYDENNWTADDFDFIFFVNARDQRNMKHHWIDSHRVIIENVEMTTTKIIPALQSAEEIDLATVYDPSWRDPHPVAHVLKNFGATAETKAASLTMGQTDNGSSTISIIVTFKEPANADTNKLFLIYNHGDFELAAAKTSAKSTILE